MMRLSGPHRLQATDNPSKPPTNSRGSSCEEPQLRQMQRWTDIQLVWNREETSEVYGQRDDILADSRRQEALAEIFV
jgi:hypothetical protein